MAAETGLAPSASSAPLDTLAVVLEGPRALALRRLALDAPDQRDVVVDLEWSGVSAGTERLLWAGEMPAFPGLGYPLVPGYESVGRVARAGEASGRREGELVFVPGAACFGEVRGLFGGAASRLVVPGDRVVPVSEDLGDRAVLLALAATAHHALAAPHARPPDLVVGHGALGRLIARVSVARGAAPPVVWERDALRRVETTGYEVVDPDTDSRRDYHAIYDASGEASIFESLIERLGTAGEVTLAGFYKEPLRFAFPPAFMREARIRVSAEWAPGDLAAVDELIRGGQLSLDGLITHRRQATEAVDAYRTAFADPACLKMVLDWRAHS